MTQILILQEGHYRAHKRKPDAEYPWETLQEWIPVFIVDWKKPQYDMVEATLVLKKPFTFATDKFVSPAGTIIQAQFWDKNPIDLTVDVEKINGISSSR